MFAFRLGLFLLLILSATSLRAGDDGMPTGEQLVRKLFAEMKAGNVSAVEAMISPAFQSVHEDGARDRDQEIELVRNLDMGEVTLDNFTETRSGDILVVSYTVSAEETIGGKRLSKKPAYRLTIFQQTGSGWQWAAHANLKSMQ